MKIYCESFKTSGREGLKIRSWHPKYRRIYMKTGAVKVRNSMQALFLKILCKFNDAGSVVFDICRAIKMLTSFAREFLKFQVQTKYFG